MTKNLLKFALALSLIVGFTACGKDNDNPEQPGNGGEETTQTVVLLTKMQTSYVAYDESETSNSITTFTYNSNNQLTVFAWLQTDGENTGTETSKVYYTDGKLSGSSVSSNGNGGDKDSSRVETDAQGKVVKATFYSSEDNFKNPTKILTYKWSGDKVTEVANLTDGKTYPIAYTNGNITLIDNTAENIKYTAAFDDKKNPYSLLLNTLLAANNSWDDFLNIPEDDSFITTFCANNITKSTLEENGSKREHTYTYEYNEDGYATKSVENGMNGVTTTTFTYEKKTVTVKN